MRDLAPLMKPAAVLLLGEPNESLSKAKELRFGRKGSLCVNLSKGAWFDFEADAGGGLLDLIARETGATTNRDCFEWLERAGLLPEGEGLHKCSVEPMKPQRAPPKAPEPSRTAIYAKELWLRSNKADAAVASHPYAVTKGITWAAGAGRAMASGTVIGKNADCIVAPVRTLVGRLIAVQCINTEGAKQTFGALGADGCLLLGNTLDRSIPWAVVEGWADAVSFVFHVYQGNAVAACAFGKNRMDRIAEALAAHYGPDRIYIMEDAA
jgi:phage/plasmid primase-like uncharacterized protein